MSSVYVLLGYQEIKYGSVGLTCGMHPCLQTRDPDGSSMLCGNCFHGNLFSHLFMGFEYIATLEKTCNGFWISEDIRFTVNVDAQVLQKV